MAETPCASNRNTAAAASEKSIVNSIIHWLNSLSECYVVKTYGSIYSAGQPDLLGCFKGRPLALEVKRPGQRPTKLQWAILKRWQAAGAIAAVVCSVEDVRKLLEEEGMKGWREML